MNICLTPERKFAKDLMQQQQYNNRERYIKYWTDNNTRKIEMILHDCQRNERLYNTTYGNSVLYKFSREKIRHRTDNRSSRAARQWWCLSRKNGTSWWIRYHLVILIRFSQGFLTPDSVHASERGKVGSHHGLFDAYRGPRPGEARCGIGWFDRDEPVFHRALHAHMSTPLWQLHFYSKAEVLRATRAFV